MIADAKRIKRPRHTGRSRRQLRQSATGLAECPHGPAAMYNILQRLLRCTLRILLCWYFYFACEKRHMSCDTTSGRGRGV